MTLTAFRLEAPITHALVWTLIHFLWEGALIALLLAIALQGLRDSSARLRYGLACLGMLVMLAAFAGTLARLWPQLAGRMENQPARLWALTHPPGSVAGAGAMAASGDGWLTWLLPLWMLGVCAFAARSLFSWAAARRLRKTGVCLAPGHWQNKLRQMAARMRIAKPVELFESALAEVPVVIGSLRPVILIPAGLLANFPAEQLEYFLIHELAHILRRDYLVNLAQTFAEDLLFFHPAVWWVSAVIRKERENCCDDVVAAHANAREYAAALVALEQKRTLGGEAVLAANGGHLMNRIQRLLGVRANMRAADAPRGGGGLLAGGLLVVFAAIGIGATRTLPAGEPSRYLSRPENTSPSPAIVPGLNARNKRESVLLAQARENPPAAPNPAVENRLQKWVDEDAVYIITDEERSAFKRLQSDAEREMFVEQFWLRRDPTPNTPENEFKEEHYRRIAFANERYTVNGNPGWRSDRGRTYIAFGPPDEIDSHPNAGDASPSPYEDWRYRFIEGIGRDVDMRFVDEGGTGEYRMTMDPSEKDAVVKGQRTN